MNVNLSLLQQQLPDFLPESMNININIKKADVYKIACICMSLAMICIVIPTGTKNLDSVSSGADNLRRAATSHKTTNSSTLKLLQHPDPPKLMASTIPIDARLSKSIAAAIIHGQPFVVSTKDKTRIDKKHIDADKFWSMFAKKGWARTTNSKVDACFREPNFWQNVLTNSRCDRNWYMGGFDDGDARNFKEFRPVFKDYQPAPALLGMDVDMWEYNCLKIWKTRGETPPKREREPGDEDGPGVECPEGIDFVNAGFHTGVQMLRLDASEGWNMCRNLEWISCALQGELPNQNGGKVRFATGVNQGVEEYLFRDDKCDDDNDACLSEIEMEDIYFAEIALISYMCKNGKDLFKIKYAKDFDCDFDHDAISRLADASFKSPGGLATKEMFTRPWEKKHGR